MHVDVHSVVQGELAERVWRLYDEAFDELRTRAVQRHLMTREEFDEVARDRRVDKYVGIDPDRGDRPCALATFTNQLRAMPLISPEYFRRRWPRHYEEGRIWYLGFICVHPEYRGSGIAEQVVEALYRVVSARQGIAALDLCRYNEETYRLHEAIQRMLEALAGRVRSERMDQQSYWLYEFPTAA